MSEGSYQCANAYCSRRAAVDGKSGGFCCRQCHHYWYTGRFFGPHGPVCDGRRCSRAPHAMPIPPWDPLPGAVYNEEEDDRADVVNADAATAGDANVRASGAAASAMAASATTASGVRLGGGTRASSSAAMASPPDLAASNPIGSRTTTLDGGAPHDRPAAPSGTSAVGGANSDAASARPPNHAAHTEVFVRGCASAVAASASAMSGVQLGGRTPASSGAAMTSPPDLAASNPIGSRTTTPDGGAPHDRPAAPSCTSAVDGANSDAASATPPNHAAHTEVFVRGAASAMAASASAMSGVQLGGRTPASSGAAMTSPPDLAASNPIVSRTRLMEALLDRPAVPSGTSAVGGANSDAASATPANHAAHTVVFARGAASAMAASATTASGVRLGGRTNPIGSRTTMPDGGAPHDRPAALIRAAIAMSWGGMSIDDFNHRHERLLTNIVRQHGENRASAALRSLVRSVDRRGRTSIRHLPSYMYDVLRRQGYGRTA